MVSSAASTVAKYLASLPPDRRAAIRRVRAVVRANLPPGYKEGMQYGMIGYYIPLARYPETYNGQPLGVIGLASQKGYMALYLMAVYGDARLNRWFVDAYRASGKKLDMGKSCLRFKTLDDLPLDVIAQVVRAVSVEDFIARVEAVQPRKPKPKPKPSPKLSPRTSPRTARATRPVRARTPGSRRARPSPARRRRRR